MYLLLIKMLLGPMHIDKLILELKVKPALDSRMEKQQIRYYGQVKHYLLLDDSTR